ncbi:hypothetical protein SASPL_106604 [Salvia splendens]|uniref:Uncharacterized protein n=1 Tax=Salvia splendens TaxID=180675 RepID=A0A8X8YN51_SALSN|nr:hypothetical protein SASPL_106604 [Salvia splendens]
MYGLVARAWILHMEVVKWKTGVDQGFNWHALLEILWFKVLMIAPLKAIKFSDWGNLDAIESGISAFHALAFSFGFPIANFSWFYKKKTGNGNSSIDTRDCRSFEAVQVLVHVADGRKILLEAVPVSCIADLLVLVLSYSDAW